jgi:hypothetical protein
MLKATMPSVLIIQRHASVSSMKTLTAAQKSFFAKFISASGNKNVLRPPCK